MAGGSVGRGHQVVREKGVARLGREGAKKEVAAGEGMARCGGAGGSCMGLCVCAMLRQASMAIKHVVWWCYGTRRAVRAPG